MNTAKKLLVAKEFIECHKISDIDEWQPLNLSGDDKLITIYDNLAGGLYGEVRDLEVEISLSDSKSGNPIIFEWSDKMTYQVGDTNNGPFSDVYPYLPAALEELDRLNDEKEAFKAEMIAEGREDGIDDEFYYFIADAETGEELDLY